MTSRLPDPKHAARLAIVERRVEEASEKADTATGDVRTLDQRVIAIEKTINDEKHGLVAISTKLDEILEARKASGQHRATTEARISSLSDAQRELAAKLAIAREDFAKELKASAEPIDETEKRALLAEMYRSFRVQIPRVVWFVCALVVAILVTAIVWVERLRP